MGKKKAVPGPGEYEFKEQIGNGIKYSIRQKTENKFDITKLVVSPGPANYEPNWNPRLKSATSYTIRVRTKNGGDTIKNPKTGPGSYNLERNFVMPSYKFDKTPRQKLLSKSVQEFPAPNKYEIRSDFGKSTAIMLVYLLRILGFLRV